MIFINRGSSSVSLVQNTSKKDACIRNGTRAIRIRSVARID